MTADPPRPSAAGANFAAAAEVLRHAGDPAAPPSDPRVRAFLQSVDLWPADDAAPDPHAVRMLAFAAGLEKFFRLDSPLAPGARFCGAQDAGTVFRPGGNYAGRGLSMKAALFTCLGEAAEFSAMHRRDADSRILEGAILGRSLVSGERVSIPAERALRTADPLQTSPSSTGYAAGHTFDLAIESALLECIERDAIARWSLGESRPTLIPVDAALHDNLHAIGRTDPRPVLFADMASPGALAHAVVAVSTGEDGLGTVLGFGAAFSRQEACRKALLELCQGEIGMMMMMARRPAASLSAKDVEALERSKTLVPGRGLLDFAAPDPAFSGSGEARPGTLDEAVAHARATGPDVQAFDLTVTGEDIPVAKVLVEGLLDAATVPRTGDAPPLL